MKYAFMSVGLLVAGIVAGAVLLLLVADVVDRRERNRQAVLNEQDRLACDQARRLGLARGRSEFLANPDGLTPPRPDFPPRLDPRADAATVRQVLERRQDVAWRSGVYRGWCDACSEQFHADIAQLPEVAA